MYTPCYAGFIPDRHLQCCEQIFLSASGVLADTQEALLGIYNLTGLHENRPFYTKILASSGQTFFFFYKTEGERDK